MSGTTEAGGRRRSKGFRQAGSLVAGPVRKVGEARGFAVTRLLTHWDEVAGPDIAPIARPIEIGYGRGGMGATLVLLTTGAHAPVLQMQEARLRERINACYGYSAISRIRITQTAPTGFSEGQAAFGPVSTPPRGAPDPQDRAQAQKLAHGVASDELRQALEALGAHVLRKSARGSRSTTER